MTFFFSKKIKAESGSLYFIKASRWQTFESKKQHTGKTMLITMAPDDDTWRSCEARRLLLTLGYLQHYEAYFLSTINIAYITDRLTNKLTPFINRAG